MFLFGSGWGGVGWGLSGLFFNKTGTRQCARAIWSTFADVHSPGALMHYLGSLEFTVICDT